MKSSLTVPVGTSAATCACIETGERWLTYGYTTLAPAGEVIMSYQLARTAA